METTQENRFISVGKQIWLKYFKWIVVGVLLLLTVIGVYLYNRGKKDTLAQVPKDVPYPPSSGLPIQDAAKIKWIDTTGSALVKKLGAYLKDWHFTNIGINTIIVQELRPLADWQLVAVNNQYKNNYFSQGKGTLVKDLQAITYVGADGIRNEIVSRLQKLGAE